MKIIKRNGVEVDFDTSKIINAIYKANQSIDVRDRLTEEKIHEIADDVTKECIERNHEINVEEIQDMVEKRLIETGSYQIAKNYITYRYTHQINREGSDLDKKILSIVDCINEEVKQENSNKDTNINSTQRDYIAGEVSRDITMRLLVDPDIKEAHDKGIIHFHDSDYFIQHMHNCCLCNLEDILQNGTVISGTLIEKPHAFSTACNIATQIIAQVSSGQYGGQTISLAHLAPFVDVSRSRIYTEVMDEFQKIYGDISTLTAEQTMMMDDIVKNRLQKEINKGVQTIQYQILTLLTTNGQTPFISVCMYLNEAHNEKEKEDLALIIEEVLNQRIKGIKNEKGIYITPAFPKLLYFLEDDNSKPGTKYWYLTELAAKCTAKRMVPDYISEKVMKSIKIDSNGDGNAYPSMGCVSYDSTITYMMDGKTYTEYIGIAWDRITKTYNVEVQPNGIDLYVNTPGIKIWDHRSNAFIEQYRMIRNTQKHWRCVKFNNGIHIDVTDDHPFEINGKGVVLAKDINIGDEVYCTSDLKTDDSNVCNVVSIESYEKEQYSYDVTTETEHFTVNGLWSHNCRSFLTPYIDPETNKPKYYGRFNQGVVTINLPYIALASHGDFDKFWEIFDKYLEMCYRALMIRHNRLLGTLSDVSPIMWQYGALTRLKKGEVIDKYLFGGYSTISLGYAGLYECVKYMTGKSHTDEEGKPFAIEVMQHLNDKCDEWREKENIAFSVYGTPIESTTYKFAKALKRDFGTIEGITDHNYITNSYHVNVRENIDAFKKLSFEAEFQKLSPGGAISYIEVPNMQDNIEAILSVIQFIYENIMYAEINTKSDYCEVCGYDGEIKIVERDGKLIWECPKCGNTDQNKMSVARRTCGYIGTQFWNQGRTEEIRDRVLHL